MDKPIDPPPGCQEIPGFILVVFGGRVWFTQDGELTNDWNKRGVWKTVQEAETAHATFTVNLD